MNKQDQDLCDCMAHLMGWVREGGAWRPGPTDHSTIVWIWNPVEDANDTERVIEAMISGGYDWDMSNDNRDGLWDVGVGDGTHSHDAHDKRLRAVCLAAKAAMKASCVATPKHWPPRYNSNTPCDSIDGPCCCGSWHGPDDSWVREQIQRHGLKPRAVKESE